jgi:hypothetical protein
LPASRCVCKQHFGVAGLMVGSSTPAFSMQQAAGTCYSIKVV